MSTSLENLSERVYCINCKGKRNHKIIQTYKEFSDPGDEFHWHASYHIVTCSGCDKIAFVEQYGDEDTWDYIDGEREWVDIFKVYPEEPIEEIQENKWFERYKIEVKHFKHTPKIIVDLYEQIVESFNNQHFILCTSGLRTLIEGICGELGITKGHLYDDQRNKKLNKHRQEIISDSLGGRIFGLYEEGLILFPQSLILQKVKDIGNGAIHDITVPSIPTIKDIIKVLEDVIYSIYEIRNHKLLKE